MASLHLTSANCKTILCISFFFVFFLFWIKKFGIYYFCDARAMASVNLFSWTIPHYWFKINMKIKLMLHECYVKIKTTWKSKYDLKTFLKLNFNLILMFSWSSLARHQEISTYGWSLPRYWFRIKMKSWNYMKITKNQNMFLKHLSS